MQVQTTKPVSVPPREPFQFLERELAAWVGYSAESVVACSSGTAALHLALEALQLPPGSEVICPDYTMVACPRAIAMAGLVPVFVDCGDDLLVDTELLYRAVSHETRAVMPVHIYGRVCNMAAISAFARECTLHTIEDMAEAHGVVPYPYTDAACWSFYRNKCVHGEEGGAVAFSMLYNKGLRPVLARQLRSLGFTADHDYNHVPRGHNYRMSNAHAQLIRRSLSEVDWNIEQRRTIEGWYDRYCPDEWKMPRRDAVWVYDLRIPGMTGEQQTRVVRALQANGIAARFGFKPMSAQEEFKQCRVIGNGNAARLASEILYLPCQPGITTEADAERSFGVIRRSL